MPNSVSSSVAIPARTSGSHRPARRRKGDKDDDEKDKKKDNFITIGGFRFSRRKWGVRRVLAWRINRSTYNIEFLIEWNIGGRSWEPLAGAGDYAHSVVDFMRDLPDPPPEWSERYNNWVNPSTGRPYPGPAP